MAETPKSRLDQMAEAVQLKLTSRIVMAVLLPLTLAIGGYVTTQWLAKLDGKLDSLTVGQGFAHDQALRSDGRLGTLEGAVRALTEQSYRPADAVKDFALQNSKNLEQDRRLDMDEQRMLNVESRVHSLETQN